MARTKPRPQFASVEQPFGYPPPTIHCPICGHAPLPRGADEVDPCPHLAFVDVSGEFAYKSEAFESRFAAVKDNEDLMGDLEAQLSECGYGTNLLALEVTYGGLACGPVWFSDVYGFDFDSIKDDRADEDEADEEEQPGQHP